MSRRPCPVCAAAEVEALCRRDLELPAEFGLPGAFDIVACAGCGMVYADVPADPRRLAGYYRASAYLHGDTADHTLDSLPLDAGLTVGAPIDARRARSAARNVAAIAPARDARVLDVGCAGGELLAALADEGFTDVQGIDPSPLAVAAARQRGRRAQVGDVETPPADLGAFDVVVLTHVLEHLGKPREALARLRDIVAPGGVVYAEVPDAGRYADDVTEPFAEFNAEHINHFSAPQLDELMRLGGFEPISSGRNDFDLADGWPYPAIYGAWRLVEPLPAARPALPDDRLRERVIDYIDRSRELLASIDARLAAALSGRRRIAVRCLGHRAWSLLGCTMLRDLDIVAFIDSQPAKQSLTIRGIRACGPDVSLDDDIPVVVLAYHAEAAVVAEYAAAEPRREVIVLGRSRAR